MILTQPTPLQSFDAAAIPQQIKELKRWTPWRARWDSVRGKHDKLPMNARQPEYGVSTAQPEKWADFDTALASLQNSDGMMHGLGYLMTGEHGIIGFDLDKCVDDGVLAPWAREVIDAVGSYTEISPSGKGVRIFALGSLDGGDWMNHHVGIEVYGGSGARFLTVTGRPIVGAGTAKIKAVAPSVLAGLRGTYGRANDTPKPADKPLPELLGSGALPIVNDLDLPPAASAFLSDGEIGPSGDRSRILHSTAVSLFSAGLSLQEVFSTLKHNTHAFEVALAHRRQDEDRADIYLWQQHCLVAQPKARPRALTAADFDDIAAEADMADSQSAGSVVSGGGDVADDFEDVSGGEKSEGKAPVKKPRFDIVRADKYVQNVRMLKWFYKGVMPRADTVAIYGESGSGKTFFALDMVCCLAMGMEWFGIPSKPTKVLYVAAEGASGMRDRTLAWCLSNNVSINALGENLSILGDQPNMLEKDDPKALVQAARAACPGIELVVLDTMAQVTPGANENSGEDMGRFLSNVRAVGKALDSTMLLIGHSGKDAMRGLRGWSGLRAALDAELEVIRTREYRAATVTKLKDGVGEGMEYRFDIPTHVVDWDMDDDTLVESCAVEAIGVFDANQGMSARDTAANERKGAGKNGVEKAAEVKGPDTTGMRGKQKDVLEYLQAHLDVDKGVHEDAVREEVLAHFATVEGFFSLASVQKGDHRAHVKRWVSALTTRAFLRQEGKYLFLAKRETCDF